MDGTEQKSVVSVHEAPFGQTPDGQAVAIWTLRNSAAEVRIITLGARVQTILVPDRTGALADIALGYGKVADYFEGKNTYFGAIVGRYANRIGGGQFSLGGKQYQITLPAGQKNSLHGGAVGFDMLVWSAREIPGGVEMSLTSIDGDQGFPGTLSVHVSYTLQGSALHIGFRSETDKETVLNLTNHTYFNLAGEGVGLITDEIVTLNAPQFVVVRDAEMIPTGELRAVEGTPLDLRQPKRIADEVDAPYDQLQFGGGYDHCWVLEGNAGELREAARVEHPPSGRTLSVLTTEPGIQFYSGNSLDGSHTGKTGREYVRRSGLCLETQHFPDSPNHPNFPSTVLQPGVVCTSETVFRFGTTD